MEPRKARTILLEQHDRLRVSLTRCQGLACSLRDGAQVREELDVAVTQLRVDFADHNVVEANLIRPLLEDSPDWGAVLLDRMLEEHVGEHAAFWELLAGPIDEVAARMDDLVDQLDAHMAAEERTFLSPSVLRAETIASRRREPR